MGSLTEINAFEHGNGFSLPPHLLPGQQFILMTSEAQCSMKEIDYKARDCTSFASLELTLQQPLFQKGGLRVPEMKSSFPDSPWIQGSGEGQRQS